MNDKQSQLENAAYDVAEEYRDGKLPHIAKSWEDTLASLCAELERRCPGFDPQAYRDALADGFKASR